MDDRRQGTPKLTDEQKLEMLNERLTELKAEYKGVMTPGSRQLIHEDIVDTIGRIERLQAKLAARD